MAPLRGPLMLWAQVAPESEPVGFLGTLQIGDPGDPFLHRAVRNVSAPQAASVWMDPRACPLARPATGCPQREPCRLHHLERRLRRRGERPTSPRADKVQKI